MRDRLIKLLQEFADGTITGNGHIVDGTEVNLIADYLLANGVIVLRCKIGDTVYQINNTYPGGEIYELEIFDVSIYKGKPYYETESIDFDDTAIGKSIFLTKEEAEQALKMKGGAEE